MSISAALVGMALPHVDLAGHRSRAAVVEMSTTLSAAQSRAVLGQHDVIVAFDTLAGTVRVHLDANNDGAVQTTEHARLVQVSEGIRFSRGAAPAMALGGSGVTFTRVQDGLPSVVFHRNGSASQAGVVYLVPGGDGGMSMDVDHVRAVEVARPTGRATCLRVKDGAWGESC